MCWTGPDATGSKGASGALSEAKRGEGLGLPAGCMCGQSDKSQTEDVWVEARCFALCDHILFHQQEVKEVTRARVAAGELSAPWTGPCAHNICGVAPRCKGLRRICARGHAHGRTRRHARSSFQPGRPSCLLQCHVWTTSTGPLPLDTTSGSRGVTEDLPPAEKRRFSGRGQEGLSEPVCLPHEAGLCGQSGR